MSSASSRSAIFIAVLMANTGCSPLANDAPPLSGIDAWNGCMSSDDCAMPTSVCLVETRTCVQCSPTHAAACMGDSPVCGGDNRCHACSTHAECASSACLPTGACGDDTSVAYVDPLGSGTQCTKERPCVKIADAVKTDRPYVKFHGTTDEQLVLNGSHVTFLADPGARLTSSKSGILLKIEGSTQLVIYDLELGGVQGASAAAISLQAGNTATIDLVHMTVRGNSGLGIFASDGSLNVSRSTIVENRGGGISLTGTSFRIVNNVISRNGAQTSAAVGGVELRTITSLDSKLEFNTIVDNVADLDVLSSGGVLCDRRGFMATGNLIFRNVGGSTGGVQTLGNCTYPSSFINAGAGSADNTPVFAHPNALPFDYHLTAMSPASIVDAGGDCTGTDFDGEPRPRGVACDVGAYERNP